MVKKLFYFAFSVIAILFLPSSLKSQFSDGNDSLLYYLDNIKERNDTNSFKGAIAWLYGSSEYVLLDDRVFTKIINLENKIDNIDYYDLVMAYCQQMIFFNTPACNEKSIAIMIRWIEEHDNVKLPYGHHSLLFVLRELRLPFRNSGRLNESIEYYLGAEKRYLAVNDSDAVSITYSALSGSYSKLGMYEKASYYQLKSVSFLNDRQENYNIFPGSQMLGKAGKVNRYAVLGSYFVRAKKPSKANTYLREAIMLYHALKEPMLMSDIPFLFLQMARCKTLEKSDSAEYYYNKALVYLKLYKSSPLEYSNYYQERSADFLDKNMLDSAMSYIDKSKQIIAEFELGISSYFGELIPSYYEASIYVKTKQPLKAIPLLQAEIEQLKELNLNTLVIEELVLLSEALVMAKEEQTAYEVLLEAFSLKQKMVNDESEARSLSFETEKKMQESENKISLLDEQNVTNKNLRFYLYGIVSLLILIVVGLAVFYYNKKRSNKKLSESNDRLSDTIHLLKEAQSQLIQTEKMASLGELTAGIAHEIQNPLNFVNNFSEVSIELLEEMKEEIEKGNLNQIKALAQDIIDNSSKINFHGKRADSIVKGMLQHSRKNNNVKVPTDINELADEYLRLAYHAFRAKDSAFNTKINTAFDKTIVSVNVIPQDMGRVLLNLVTNALYAVKQKAKQSDGNYEPTITVSTVKEGGTIQINVKDNGEGIPQHIIDKIFQPFFTTKPTGEGTGLGLSISYESITKAHGGQLIVSSSEGEWSEFVVRIPA